MDWSAWCLELEERLGVPLKLVVPVGGASTGTSVAQMPQVVAAEGALTAREQELLRLLVSSKREQAESAALALSREEQEARALRQWLLALERGEPATLPAERVIARLRLRERHVPILLREQQLPGSWTITAGELRRLLESFYEVRMGVLSLGQGEWLLLVPEELLGIDVAWEFSGERTVEGESGERPQEALDGLAQALHTMLVNEWGATCVLVVDEPLVPLDQLGDALRRLRDCLELAELFHRSDTTLAPWHLPLEHLLYQLPAKAREAFVQELTIGRGWVLDAELVATLEAFFQTNCNVSDTAKKLYIHRNTLVYRLDKIRQETGLDVRTFPDALLVRLMLLLDNMTKMTKPKP